MENRADFVPIAEACEAKILTSPGLEERAFDSSGLFSKGRRQESTVRAKR